MITQQHLKERLYYDPETGVFTWLNGRRKGKSAGSKDSYGYLVIVLVVDKSRKAYKAHRLAWLYTFGEWLSGIDHKNRKPADNRLCNLRLATSSQSNMNRSTKNDALGFGGTYWKIRKNRWRARIQTTIGRKHRRYNLGLFDTREEAAAVYVAASKLLHREFRRAA